MKHSAAPTLLLLLLPSPILAFPAPLPPAITDGLTPFIPDSPPREPLIVTTNPGFIDPDPEQLTPIPFPIEFQLSTPHLFPTPITARIPVFTPALDLDLLGLPSLPKKPLAGDILLPRDAAADADSDGPVTVYAPETIYTYYHTTTSLLLSPSPATKSSTSYTPMTWGTPLTSTKTSLAVKATTATTKLPPPTLTENPPMEITIPAATPPPKATKEMSTSSDTAIDGDPRCTCCDLSPISTASYDYDTVSKRCLPPQTAGTGTETAPLPSDVVVERQLAPEPLEDPSTRPPPRILKRELEPLEDPSVRPPPRFLRREPGRIMERKLEPLEDPSTRPPPIIERRDLEWLEDPSTRPPPKVAKRELEPLEDPSTRPPVRMRGMWRAR